MSQKSTKSEFFNLFVIDVKSCEQSTLLEKAHLSSYQVAPKLKLLDIHHNN